MHILIYELTYNSEIYKASLANLRLRKQTVNFTLYSFTLHRAASGGGFSKPGSCFHEAEIFFTALCEADLPKEAAPRQI